MDDCFSKWVFFTWHQKDNNMLETCIRSLKLVCPEANCIIATDGVPDDVRTFLAETYDVIWIDVEPTQMKNRRATCKLEVLLNCANHMFEPFDQVIVSDVDVYYQADPFTAFVEHPLMDLGLTTRGYRHLFPINGGMFFIRMSNRMKLWIVWHVDEIHSPRWPPYVAHRKKYHHEHFGLDWSVGQDFLIATWICRSELRETKGLVIEDVGPAYNFCPPTDVIGDKAFDQVRAALAGDMIADKTIEGESVLSPAVVIHLKSDLKRMIYEDGLFPNAIHRHPKGAVAWT